MEKKQRWNMRGLVSLLTLGGFLVMSVTGLMLYIVPQGRIAYWTDWHLLGLSKTQWGDIHILSSVLFIIAGAFHTTFNWKQLMRYFYNKAKGAMTLKRELTVAVLVTVLATVSGIYHLPPLSLLIDLNEAVKAAWVTKPEHEPPFGHAEELSLKVLCRKVRMPLDKAKATLIAKGLTVRSDGDSLKTLARANNTTPMALYAAIRHLEPTLKPVNGGDNKPRAFTAEQVEETFANTGVGSKTLPQLATQVGVTPTVLRNRLKQNNIELADDMPLRKAADAGGLSPIELLKTLLVDGYKPQKK